MRLEIHATGPGTLTCTVAEGTLRHRHHVAYAQDRVQEIAREMLLVLHRSNQTHRLSESNLDRLRVLGEELGRRLLPSPVLTELRRSMGVLTLELDEELLSLPWELVYDGEQFLCRRFDMGRIVRTPQPLRASVVRPRQSPPLKLLILTPNPDRDLPQAEREGMELLQSLENQQAILARLVVEPTLEFVRRELKDYDLVHFAGHALHPEQGVPEPAWRLTDGVLTVSEIAAMGVGRPMPRLVFSNACHSGRSPTSGGGFSLAQAFLAAGVQHYVGAQWEVVDGQGAQFARHFYADLAQAATVGAAVRNARNRVVAESGEAQLAWATYVLYGDPEDVLVNREVRAESLADVAPDLRLGVRATAPYKPKSRPKSSPSTEAVGGPVRNGTLRWVALAALAAALVSLFAAAATGVGLWYVSRSFRRLRRPSTVVKHEPSRPALTIVSQGAGNPQDQDLAALLAACLAERLTGEFVVVDPGSATRDVARVLVDLRRVDGKLLVAVSVRRHGRVLSSQVLPLTEDTLERTCGEASDRIRLGLRRLL